MDVLEIYAENKYNNHEGFHNAWLVRDGVTVGFFYCRYAEQPVKSRNGKVVVVDAGLNSCGIETRPGYRNQGVASTLLKMTKEYFGVNKVILQSCAFTPDGFNFLSGKLVMPEGADEPVKPEFKPMAFVVDWDKRVKVLDS